MLCGVLCVPVSTIRLQHGHCREGSGQQAFQPTSAFTSFTYWGLQYIFIRRKCLVYKSKVFWGQGGYKWEWVYGNESPEKGLIFVNYCSISQLDFFIPVVSNHITMWLALLPLPLDSYLNMICCITQLPMHETRAGSHVLRKGVLINTFHKNSNFLRKEIFMYLGMG